MFNTSFDFKLKNKQARNGQSVWTYSFKSTKTKQQYIVEVIFYDDYICTLVFYLKNHRLSENKFYKNTNLYEATYIIATCLKIYKQILFNYDFPYLTLFVEGVWGEKETREKVSKRFKIYKGVFQTFFSPNNYHFYIKEKHNIIILAPKCLDKKQLKTTIQQILTIITS